MRIHAGIDSSSVMDILANAPFTERRQGIAVAHAMAHGCYHSGRYTVVYDYDDGTFVVVVVSS